MQTRTVTAHIPLDLAEQLDASAARHDRPRGWVIKQALQNWISLEEKRHQMTLEGLKDVDEGRLIPHSEIEAWVRSLDDDAAD